MTAYVMVGTDGPAPASAVPRREATDAARTARGGHGLGGLGAAVLGSVGHGVPHHARCPVAVVRAAGEA